jgi:hypothetical protein
MTKGKAIMPSQRDVLRKLVAGFGMNEERVVQEYAAAERRGEVKRKSDEHGTNPEAYARALWNDAVRKGWVSGVGK